MLKRSSAISAAISAFAIASAAADQTSTQAEDDIPSTIVDVKCPADNAGTLDMTVNSLTGRAMNVKVQYRGPKGQEQPVRIEWDLDPSVSGAAREQNTIDPRDELSDADRVSAEKTLNLTNKILNRICNGSDDERQRFERWLEGNRESLSSR